MVSEETYYKLLSILNLERQLRERYQITKLPIEANIMEIYCGGVYNIIDNMDLLDVYPVDKIVNDINNDFKREILMGSSSTIDRIQAVVEAYNVNRRIDEEMNIVTLNEDWKSKIQSYLEHIREIVRKAEIEEGIRERIMSRIADISKDVERNRTNLARYGEAWVEMTAAAGKGFENLKPAIELLERTTKMLSKLREFIRPSLPSPETRQLPPPEEIDTE